ncbi:MAG: hypothetical protein INR73_03655 [Williamsia sp.]|nr:hypothetical protein [Williamsia sp.]
MSYIKLALTSCLLLISTIGHSQNQISFNEKEKEILKLFNNFKEYLILSIDKDIEVSDTSQIKHVLLNYILPESSLDTNNRSHFKESEISSRKLSLFISEFKKFHQYFFEQKDRSLAEHLSILPIRLSPNKCIYKEMTLFQQQYTFVYYDNRFPEKILGYILFAPKFKNITSGPRIWSWTLQFDAGHWAFRSPMGTVGMEYFISDGSKGPEQPIGN